MISRIDSLVFSVGSLSTAVAQWILVLMLARFAGGAESVGEYSLLIAIATPVFVIGQFGLRTVFLSLQTEYGWAIYRKLRLLGIAVGIVVMAILVFGIGFENLALAGAIIVLKCADAYLDLLYARMQRLNLLRRIGTISFVNSLLTIIVAACLLWQYGSVSAAITGSALASCVMVIVAQRMTSRVSVHNSPAISGYHQILKAGLPTTVSEVTASVSAYMPILFLSIISNERDVGIYTGAAYLLTFANLAGAILKNVVITPFRIDYEISGTPTLLHGAHRKSVILLACSVVLAPIVVAFGSPVLEFVYGPGFGLSYGELTLLALAVVPIASSYLYSAVLNVLNAFTSQAWGWLIACLIGLGAGALMVSLGKPVMTSALSVAFAISWGRAIGVFIMIKIASRNS